MINPTAFIEIWQNNIYLIGSAALGASAVFSFVGPFVIEIIKDNELFTKSVRVLRIETENAKRRLQPSLLGLNSLLSRTEATTIIDRLSYTKSILFSGEAGVGKSGIGVQIINSSNQFCFLFDVRRLSGVTTISELSTLLGLQENIFEVITRIANRNQCIVIFDQLDSVCETSLGRLIVDLAIEIKKIKKVSVIVISRHSEIEQRLLRPLLEENFEEIPCELLHDETVESLLKSYGVENPSEEIIDLGKNILMLDLICSIVKEQGSIDNEDIVDEISIWDKYIDLLLIREEENLGIGKEIILSNMTLLAKRGLQSEDKGFLLDDPPSNIQNRFISQGIITRINDNGRRYIFKVEKLQDYLYARNATQRELLKYQVEEEICTFHLRNIL